MPIASEPEMIRNYPTVSKAIHNSLFLILTLALVAVPVFLMAHAFTHFAQTDTQNTIDIEEEAVDLDEICLDCLALTGFNVLLFAAILWRNESLSRYRLLLRLPAHIINNHHRSYHSRAPPAYAY